MGAPSCIVSICDACFACLQYRLAHQQREAQKTEILMEKHALTPPRSSVEF